MVLFLFVVMMLDIESGTAARGLRALSCRSGPWWCWWWSPMLALVVGARDFGLEAATPRPARAEAGYSNTAELGRAAVHRTTCTRSRLPP
ncbi:MAG: hypothetical protein U5K43_00570 [Halofilum sp. (in: g-proteobacteria)]|nr:hypothetical protein [Halofilum sp. (in: g-proteobacteria)]